MAGPSRLGADFMEGLHSKSGHSLAARLQGDETVSRNSWPGLGRRPVALTLKALVIVVPARIVVALIPWLNLCGHGLRRSRR